MQPAALYASDVEFSFAATVLDTAACCIVFDFVNNTYDSIRIVLYCIVLYEQA